VADGFSAEHRTQVAQAEEIASRVAEEAA